MINTTPIHVLGISGSLRRESFNTKLLIAASELLPAGMTLELFDLSPIPMFNQDIEVDTPEPVAHFRERIALADALLVATPEYNYSVSGALKNAWDWASRPTRESALNGKPLAIMGAGGLYGTVRAQTHLRQIATHNDMFVINKPQVMVARPSEKFDAQGQLTDESVCKQIHELLVALAHWTRRLRGH